MNRIQIQQRVTQILNGFARLEVGAITSDSHLRNDLGIDSLDLLVVREALERSFTIFIADEESSALSTVVRITDLIESKLAVNNNASSVQAKLPTVPHPLSGKYLDADKTLYADIEIGMHLTGRNNLAETALLREIGHLRWEHIGLVTGVPSKEIVDEAGERLYPTFFFVEIAFPSAQPMASYGENDRLTITSTLRRFGLSMLDGEHYLFPAHWAADRKVPFATSTQAIQAGIPFLRLSNSFVKQWRGAEWLKRSRPVNPGFNRIREMAEAPDSYPASLNAKEGHPFFMPPDSYVPITAREMEIEYEIIPDRDLNGAGLLYFANYPLFLDIAERKLLRECGKLSLDDEILDRRTVVHRKSAYLSNATADDKLKIKLRAWIENPFVTKDVEPEMAPIRLFCNYEMYRVSDERLMMASSAKKVIFGFPFGETKLLSVLRDMAERAVR